MRNMELRAKLLAPGGFISLYGTTPPRADASPDRIESATEKLVARVGRLPLDGVVVYDVQDETERTAEPRPFPFLPTLDSRVYAQRLHERTGHPMVVYKCVADMSDTHWRDWLDDSQKTYDVQYLSLVGKPASHLDDRGLPLSKATRIAAAHPASFTLGGVAIAERHMNGVSEAQRLLRKTQNGCRYFISQAVYHADTTIRLLADYAQACEQEGKSPTRIILTFVPCGREKTMDFMRWLGIKIAPETALTILSSSSPLSKSIEICCENLRAILEQPYVQSLPLGVNVESVSIHKDEIDASIDLVHALQEVVQGEYNQAMG
jgi:hypothetical protein